MKRLAAVFTLAAALPAAATEVTFEITGIETTTGKVLVALFDEASFLRKPLKALRLDPVTGRIAGTLGDVPAGIYALSVVHDENENGKLDFNAIGFPIEKYGFSNNPFLMGPPRFEDARIEVNGTAKAIAVALR
jgi:uncharacterized protein (DUF2141 family)